MGNAGNAGSAGSASKTGIVGSGDSCGGGEANDTGEAADDAFTNAAGDDDEVDAGLVAAAGDDGAGNNGDGDREGSDGSGGSGSAGNGRLVTALLVLSDGDVNLVSRSDMGYKRSGKFDGRKNTKQRDA